MVTFFVVCEIHEEKVQLITHRGDRIEGWLCDLPKGLRVGDVFTGRYENGKRVTEPSTLPKFIAKAYDHEKGKEQAARKLGWTQ